MYLIAPELIKVLGLDMDGHVPPAYRHTQLPGAVEQFLVERIRHQQLGEQLATGPNRQLTGPSRHVKQPPGSGSRGMQD